MLKLHNNINKNLNFITTVFTLIKKIIISIITYVIFIILWQLLTNLLNIPNYIFPSPKEVFSYIIEYKTLLIENALITTFEAIFGLFISIIISIFLGIITLYSSYIIKIAYKLLLLIQIIPLMAIAPLIVIWFGFGIFAKIIIVATICLFPCLISFLRGIISIDKEYISLLQSMGSNKWQIFKIIIFPSSCYSLFSGLKIAVTYSVTSAVIAEYLGAEKGIGIYITRSISSFDNNALFANIICIVIITLCFYKILLLIEKLLTPWNNNLKKDISTHETL